MKLFSPDNKVMVALGRLGDLVLLNFFFLLTCLPVFTIGAAATALFTVTFRIGTDKEDGSVIPYFRAFKANFKQATIIWLILLLGGVCAYADVLIFNHLGWTLMKAPCIIVLVVLLFTATFVFPLLSQFNNTTKHTLKNALAFSVAHFPKTILLLLMNSFPFLVLFYNFMLFMQTAFLWIFLYFSAISYFDALILKKIFAPYMETEETV